MATVLPGCTFPFSTPHSKPVGRMSDSMTSASSSAPAGMGYRLVSAWGKNTYSACVLAGPVAGTPAAWRAMGVHATAAVITFSTRRDARNKDVVAGFERRNRCPHLLDYADALVSQDA